MEKKEERMGKKRGRKGERTEGKRKKEESFKEFYILV